MRKIFNLHAKISMDRCFTNFLSDLPGHLSVYIALKNITIFPQHFFVSRGRSSPTPCGRPWKLEKFYEISKNCTISPQNWKCLKILGAELHFILIFVKCLSTSGLLGVLGNRILTWLHHYNPAHGGPWFLHRKIPVGACYW